MELLMKFWNDQKQSRNIANLIIILPFFLYGGINYYYHFVESEGVINKLLFTLFYTIITILLFFRPYLFSYKTENILTDLKQLDNKNYEVNVQLKSSTTLILGRKLIKIICHPTSKATYIVNDEGFSSYKQGDSLTLLLGADNKVRQIL